MVVSILLIRVHYAGVGVVSTDTIRFVDEYCSVIVRPLEYSSINIHDTIRYDSWTNDEYYSVIVSVGVQYSINRHDMIRVDEYCSVILRTLEYSIVSIDTIQFVEYC